VVFSRLRARYPVYISNRYLSRHRRHSDSMWSKRELSGSTMRLEFLSVSRHVDFRSSPQSDRIAPQFSVVMANYNKGPYIDEAIRSVLAQSFKNWELIIVDDGSTDDSLERVRRYLGDSRIRLFEKQTNEGLPRAMIYGLAMISSEIIGILDSDDALVPEAIEKTLRVHMDEPRIGLVLSYEIKCDSHLNPLVPHSQIRAPHRTKPIIWMRGTTHFRTFKRTAFKKTIGFDTSLLSAVDWDLILKLEEVSSVHRIPEPLYLYRRLDSSLSQGPESLHRSFCSQAIVLYKAYLRRKHQAHLATMPQSVVLAWIITAVEYSLDLGEPWQAILLALRGLRITPLDSAAWRTAGKSVRTCMSLFAAGLKPWKMTNTAGFVRLKFYPVRVSHSPLQSNTGNIEPDRVVCIPVVHREGHCLFGGDFLVPENGRYKARFDIAIKAYSFAKDPLVVLDVYENLRLKGVLAERQISTDGLTGGWRSYNVEFSAEEGQRLEFRVYWAGECFLIVSGILLYKAQ
jgi:glycosyltransferase involved in cell wall biosynthesis